MPFIPNTPESLSTILSAAASPTPTSTCAGTLHSGRPCTRILKVAPNGAPTSGVIATVASSKVFFCEAHKDQSTSFVLRHTASFARRREAVGRGSMDTFIEQVELLVGSPGGTQTATKLTAHTKPYQGAIPEKKPDAFAAEADPPSPPTGWKRREKKKKRSLLRMLLSCCIGSGGDKEYSLHNDGKQTEAELRAAAAAVVEDGVARPARVHGKNKRESKVLFETTPPTPPLPMMYPARKSANSAMKQVHTPNSGIFDPRAAPGTQFNSYIPAHLSAPTQDKLREQLSKPFSDGDEPGYIYIFWLTDTPTSPSSTPGGKHTTASALLKTATAAESLPRGRNAPPRLLLKIGRANNVQRRLHEWSTQCGYNLSLVRFYPHVSASATPSPAGTPLSTPLLSAQVGRKVPNSHRIERLIHLELRDTPGVNPEIECAACGKTHKEWFWIDASRDGLRGVDEVVKKWIDYGEQSAMVTGSGAVGGLKPGAAAAASGGRTPKSKKDDPITPVKKRPTLKDAQVGGKNAGLSPSSAATGGRRVSPSPARSGRSNGGSRPGSSAGKGKGRSPGRGRKNYDNEDSGDDDYTPDDDE